MISIDGYTQITVQTPRIISHMVLSTYFEEYDVSATERAEIVSILTSGATYQTAGRFVFVRHVAASAVPANGDTLAAMLFGEG